MLTRCLLGTGLIGLLSGAQAVGQASPWTLQPAPGTHALALKLARPAYIAVFEMRPNQPLQRISPDLVGPRQELLLPNPSLDGQPSLAAMADPTVTVGYRRTGELFPLGTAPPDWDQARVVWRSPAAPRPLSPPSTTWLAVWLSAPPSPDLDARARRATGTRPPRAPAGLVDLARALGTDTAHVRVLATF